MKRRLGIRPGKGSRNQDQQAGDRSGVQLLWFRCYPLSSTGTAYFSLQPNHRVHLYHQGVETGFLLEQKELCFLTLQKYHREKNDPFMSWHLEQLCSYDFSCDLTLMWDGVVGSAPHGENGFPQQNRPLNLSLTPKRRKLGWGGIITCKDLPRRNCSWESLLVLELRSERKSPQQVIEI